MPHIARTPRQLGSIIQRVRRQRGLSQTDLANLTGLRQEMISKIETGHESTKLSALYALFAALELDLVVDVRHARTAAGIEDIF